MPDRDMVEEEARLIGGVGQGRGDMVIRRWRLEENGGRNGVSDKNTEREEARSRWH